MRPERRRLLGVGGALLLGASAGWLARERRPDPGVPESARAALQALLASSMPDLAGLPQPLVGWRGHPLLINFWASWCQPCRAEMPLLDTVSRRHAGQGLRVLGIAWDTAENARAFLQEFPVSYPVLLADDAIAERLVALGNPAAQGIPFSLFVTALGEIASLRLGAFSAQELDDRLEAILPRMGAS